MKNKMKRAILIPAIAVMVLLPLLGVVLPITLAIHSHNMRTSCSTARIQAARASLLATKQPLMVTLTDRPYDVIERPVYTSAGERLFVLEDTGLVITEDANVVVSDGDSLPIVYDEDSQQFVDMANRTLGIWLDSMERAILRRGTRHTISINLDLNVVLISVRAGGTYHLTYAFHTVARRSFWSILNPTTWGQSWDNQYFHDVTGNHIPNQYVSSTPRASLTAIFITGGATIVHPALGALVGGVISLFGNGWTVPAYEILERTTLRELMEVMTMSTIHPWPRLRDAGGTNQYVRTEDGFYIFVRPRDNQLTDRFGMPLFSMNNRGFPIMFYQNDIITIDRRPQEVENGILLHALTTDQMLSRGIDFDLAVMTTTFGRFTMPVFLEDGRMWSMTDNDVTEYVDRQYRHVIEDGTSLWDLLGGLFFGIGGALGTFLQILFWIGIVFIALFAVVIAGVGTKAIRDATS